MNTSPGMEEVTGIMTNDKIEFELRQVPVEERPPAPRTEITEDDQFPVDYVNAYAAQNEAGDWEVHVVVIYDGDMFEILLSANDSKALSGGVAMANSFILKERTREKFGRKKTPKSAE